MSDNYVDDYIYITRDRNYSHWSKRHDRFYPINASHKSLPDGVYEAHVDHEGDVYVTQIAFPSDELLNIPGMPTDYIVGQIRAFWEKEQIFKDTGLLFKRGILLYGPSGCGKTSIIRLLCDEILRRNGLVLYMSAKMEVTQRMLLKLREVEPTRPLLTIFEDIEKLMEDSNQSSEVLAFLDGEKQLSNIVHLATTNKPNILEDRLLKRPGRFDLVIGLNPPIREARAAYLKHIVKDRIPEVQLATMVDDTDGMGLAHLRELVVSILCLNLPYEDSLKRLKGNIKCEIKMPKIGQKMDAGFTLGFTKEKE